MISGNAEVLFGRWGSTSKLQNIGVNTITLKSSLVNFDIFVEKVTYKVFLTPVGCF